MTEEVQFELDVLDSYVIATYPDLRKCLNVCQMNSTDGMLTSPKGDESLLSDYKVAVVDFFKQGKINEGRKYLVQNVNPDEIEGVYRWMYDNLELFASNDESKDKAILSIRKGLVNHSFVADPEINLSATLIELTSET